VGAAAFGTFIAARGWWRPVSRASVTAWAVLGAVALALLLLLPSPFALLLMLAVATNQNVYVVVAELALVVMFAAGLLQLRRDTRVAP
jgi:membrane protein YdbS with pleckstrin-like domain